MQRYCHRSLNKFDIFGSDVGLIYKNDSLFRTAFGGIITIAFAAALIILFFHNFSTLVSKSEVSVVQSKSYDVNPSLLNFTQNQFMIAVKIDQDNFIQRPTYKIGFERRHYYTLDNGTFVQIKEPVYLEPCQISHFSSLPNQNINWTQQYIDQDLSDYLCLKENAFFPVGGRYESPDFFHLKFVATKCANVTDPKNPWQYKCASNEYIQQKLKNEDNRIKFMFSNYLLQPEKSQGVTTAFLDSLIFNIQPEKMYTTANIFMNEKIVETDESIFLIKSINKDSYITFDNGDFRQQNAVGQFDKFCEIFFLRSAFSTDIQRQFMKVDQVISYIGGFSQIFLLISTVIVSIYNEYVYYLELANRLYDFELQQPNTNNCKQNDKRPKQISIQSLAIQGIGQQTNQILSSGQLQLKSEQQIQNQNQFNKETNNQIRNENKKITNREEAGLMPIEQIKNIICSRKKTYINIANNIPRKNPLQNNDLSYIKGNKIDQISEEQASQQKSIKSIAKYEPVSEQMIILEVDKINQVQSQQSDTKIKAENGFNNSFTPKSINNIHPLIQNQQNYDDRIFAKTETNIKQSKKENDLKNNRKINSLTNQQSDIYSPESQNSILQKYEKKVFEGLGFNNAHQFLEKELEFIIKRDRSIQLSYKYFVNVITCGKLFNNEEVKLIKKANQLVRKDLDIFNVLDKIKEVEKLKKLLLTQEEQVLFNFFPKPVIKLKDEVQLPSRQQMALTQRQIQSPKIKLNSKSKQWNINLKNITTVSKAFAKFKSNLKKNRINEYETLFECYDKIMQNQESKYKNQLIYLLGDEMRNIFETTKLMQFKKQELNKNEFPNSQKLIRNSSSQSNNQEMLNNKQNANQALQSHKVSHFRSIQNVKMDESASDNQNNMKNFVPEELKMYQIYDKCNDYLEQKNEVIESQISIENRQIDEACEQNIESMQNNKICFQRNFEQLKNPLQN
ncbi:transmembrane protein, putative (macronuclear) [Tetrahymena thermophila SB210]|uniref:Transmembrane protein, putative n=1 Tax=Tetrahymena thermophila (strain SB210) TaxID=312017 RepID=Q22F25_TETTS|nr:transmembrane protein, putative [Tetrahymena thermophila SB210]EAR83850.2 transmembrane protein, putative [Tetrahymena thermophila SB210]|eukprot:XP_001031513.2 transmembrane protein, putative [Tetrahymena thermophila SB210]